MYRYVDVSDDTSSKLHRTRNMRRAGIVFHSLTEFNPLRFLQGECLNDGRASSGDYLIMYSGTVYALTRPGDFAFHMGPSRLRRLPNIHHRLDEILIGVVWETGPVLVPPYSNQQLESGSLLVQALLECHRLSVLDIWRHDDLATGPTGINCPNGFPAMRFTEMLARAPYAPKSITFPGRLP